MKKQLRTGAVSGQNDTEETAKKLITYEVDKKVEEFPDGIDLSTPEKTYATASKLMATYKRKLNQD